MIRRFVLVLLVTALSRFACAQHDPAPATENAGQPTRYVVLPLGLRGEELIGVHITDDGVREALRMAPVGSPPDVVILRINSPGGMLREVPDLVDLITDELGTPGGAGAAGGKGGVGSGVRVVAWIDLASSAAALVAMGCPEIVMRPASTVGGAVTFKMVDGRAVALVGEELERALEVGREIARRTGRDERVIRAMQTPTALSYDVDAGTGAVTLRDDAQGEKVLGDGESILTLTSVEAKEIGVSLGTASTLEEALGVLGIDPAQAEDVGRLSWRSLEKHQLMAGAAMDRLRAYHATVRRSMRSAGEAESDEARARELQRAQDALKKLRAEASRWEDVAAYLGLDPIGIEAIEAELSELYEPVGTPE
jgi:hypothetical protein